jgi:hypothetical protein
MPVKHWIIALIALFLLAVGAGRLCRLCKKERGGKQERLGGHLI